MDIKSLDIPKASQHQKYLCDCISQEWNAIELIDDFVLSSFFKSNKVYGPNDNPPVDENGIPQSFTQFVV